MKTIEMDICNNLFLDCGFSDAIWWLAGYWAGEAGTVILKTKVCSLLCFALPCCLEITVPGPSGSKATIARSLWCLTSLHTTHSIIKYKYKDKYGHIQITNTFIKHWQSFKRPGFVPCRCDNDTAGSYWSYKSIFICGNINFTKFLKLTSWKSICRRVKYQT